MFLIYKITEIYRDTSIVPVQPADAIYDVFYRFDPNEFSFLLESSDIAEYLKTDSFMDCGDWSRGYSTYYNNKSKEKHFIIRMNFDHTNPTIIKLIREYKLSRLD